MRSPDFAEAESNKMNLRKTKGGAEERKPLCSAGKTAANIVSIARPARDPLDKKKVRE